MTKGSKAARKAAKKSVSVNDLPPTSTVKAASARRRIVNTRAMVPGPGGSGSTPVLASMTGVHMAKAKKKAAKKTGTKKKAAKSRKTTKKSVAVKNLKAKASKSMKRAMTAIRRRLV